MPQSFEENSKLLRSFVLGTGSYLHQLCHGAFEAHWKRHGGVYSSTHERDTSVGADSSADSFGVGTPG